MPISSCATDLGTIKYVRPFDRIWQANFRMTSDQGFPHCESRPRWAQ